MDFVVAKETYSFRNEIPANASGIERTQLIAKAGTVEGVRIRFYQGQIFKLKVQCWVLKKAIMQPVPLVRFVGETDQYLSGDDDNFVFNRVIPVDDGDIIRVVVDNANDFTCHLAMDVDVDYYAGGRRVV